jgi:hypothetical protein
VSIRFYFNQPAWLAVLVLPLWAGIAPAQTSAPANAQPQALPTAYRSVFEGYQPYTDKKIVPWKESNDNVGRIGGWREYAKEAAQVTPGRQAPDAPAKPGSLAAPTKP